MDAQLKKGIVEVCVLSILKHEPSYGYKIIDYMSPVIEVSESTLYPILKRLETSGYLTVTAKDYQGRLRKYYHITPRGKGRILEFLDEWQEMEQAYNFIKQRERI